MMEVHNLSYFYGKNPCLKHISLEFAPGRLYAVIGPNGSGKTTLIRLLSNQAKPKVGKLALDGKAYEDCNRKEFAKKVALLPQGRNIPDMTVRDLVACGRYPYLDLSRKLTEADEGIVRSALETTGTLDFSQRNVKHLSGGERQRVYMAMLYAQDTPYVLLDEPTTHLDIASSFQILHQLTRMKQSGKCVIAVLHDLSLALKYADEIILMYGGEVLHRGSPEETVNSGLLQSVFQVGCKAIALDGEQEFIFCDRKESHQ